MSLFCIVRGYMSHDLSIPNLVECPDDPYGGQEDNGDKHHRLLVDELDG